MFRKVQFEYREDDQGGWLVPDADAVISYPDIVVGQDENGEDITEEVKDSWSEKWRGVWRVSENVGAGFYSGLEELAAYDDVLPPPKFLTSFDSSELLNALLKALTTEQTMIALSIPQLANKVTLMQIKRVEMHSTDIVYQSSIDSLVATQVMPEAMAADFRQGIPVIYSDFGGVSDE